MSPALAGRFLTPASPGKSQIILFKSQNMENFGLGRFGVIDKVPGLTYFIKPLEH